MRREQIEEGIKKIFDNTGGYSWEQREYEFSFHDDGFTVQISKMYSPIDVTFADLKSVSDLCGTDKINLGDGESYGGCESCDYGSSYGVKIDVRGMKIEA